MDQLPDYISSLINIADINIDDNNFTVKCNVCSEPIEFFWTFTASKNRSSNDNNN